MQIAVIGGGVAGSYLSVLLQRSGYDVTLFDLKGKYFKPCGDVVPNVYEPKIPWRVKYRIKNFAFYVDGEKVYDVNYRHTKWNVIDKTGWINSMIEEVRKKVIGNAKVNSKDFDLVVKAMGPYLMDRKVVYTTRSIIKTEEFDDVAVLEFDTRYTGFYWIFPDEDGVYNVGAGFLEYKNSKELLFNYLKSKFKKYEILDTRGAPITVDLVKEKDWRIGEARGLVFPMSGEGIRPSAISAEEAFNAIVKGKEFNEALSQGLRKLERRIAIQYLLLKTYINSNNYLRKKMLKTFLSNGVLVDAFLEDKIDLEGVAESMRELRNGSAIIR
ncbi:MAG: dehydrogenase (flavoprotein)-like protein [Candidatus Aramenus sulfurataquae]|jgi:flavin-dependent dehydrogenase|uniref:Dehydrogenase (Flavoprotein)-like protein n=4 Tax=Candidatus Aramenus sulfurataquae TaxID=1326980 RepID=W7KLC6_9CREN|nr:MAG: dehydrogenase (flavoprotein)-like protein [Candidatus Aramenus sulfurataquae]MCL7344029.1 NAD(P)/FAD-dependent oxidoreductase [Candidatus Aramenus sulfurataquae]